jgi:DNA-binding MarR family transcriptional regulator
MNDAPPRPDAALVTGAIGYRLRRAHLRFVENWQRQFGALGLAVAPMQGGMLVLIGRNPGITQGELARLLAVEGSTMVQAIARLKALGLIARHRGRTDRRRVALHLTAAGRDALALVEANQATHEDTVLKDLSPEERATLRDLLGRIGRG